MNHQKTIYVVFKTHFDIGFTELAEEAIERYGKVMLADVVKTCEATQDFGKEHRYVWTMPAWPLIQSLNPDYAKEDVIEKAKALIVNGQIAWHVLPFTTHTEFCGLEEYIRGMYHSKSLSEEYGKWPISAKMTDVPGHTWILPSILYKAGVRFLHLGCNPGCMPPDVPRLFYWEGPDGNRILTFYSKGAYGSSLIPPEDWPFPVWLALIQTNDNVGPQEPGIIEEIITEVNKESPNSKVIIGSLDDFYYELSQYSLNIPVIRKDLADSWIHGVGTYPREVSRLRALRNDLLSSEKALGMGRIFEVFNFDELKEYTHEITKSFEKSILFGEHTWGLDVKTTMKDNRHYNKELFLKNKNAPLYKRMEKSWDEQSQKVNHAAAMVEKIEPVILNKITGEINIDEPRIAAFNFLGWKRDAWICLDQYKNVVTDKHLVDHDSGEVLQVTYMHGSLQVFVKDLPAFGYKTFILKEGTGSISCAKRIYCSAKEGVIENNWYKLKVDKCKGIIESLIEKETGKEWIDAENEFGFGKYRYDIYGNDDITEFIKSYTYRFYAWLVEDLGRINYPEQKHLVFTTDKFTIEEENGIDYCSLKLKCKIQDNSFIKYGNASVVSTIITLYEKMPYIDLEYQLEEKEETSYIEAGHFVFPFNLKCPQFSINKLGSVVDPSMDIVKDANNILYCCENWVDVTDGENGMSVIAYDTPLFSLGDEGVYKYRREYKEEAPVLYFNAFNNSWGTNFPQWMGGDFKYRFRFFAHKGDWKQGETWKHAFESVTSVCTGFSKEKGKGSLPVKLEWIKELIGMEIMTAKPAENNDGIILRLREVSGEDHNVKISFNQQIASIDFCDILERFQKTVAVNTNEVSFVTKSFEIHTLRLRLM